MGIDPSSLVVGKAIDKAVEAGIDRVKDDLDKRLERIERYLAPVPSRRLTEQAQAAATALTYTFLGFPRPPAGHRWQLVRLSTSGPDPYTVLTGVNVVAFIGSAKPIDSNTELPGFPDILNPPGQVPNDSDFGAENAYLMGQDRVILCYKGLANSQQVVAYMTVLDSVIADYPKRG